MEEIYTSNLADGTTNETQEPLTLEDAQINALSTLAETAGTLSRAVQKIAAYVPTQWVDNSEPSITASRLMHIENGIKDATNAVNNAIDSITSLTGQVTDLNGRTVPSKILSDIVYNQDDDDIKTLVNKLISDVRVRENGVYYYSGTFKNNVGGYTATITKIPYSQGASRYYGIVQRFNHSPYMFIHSNDNIDTQYEVVSSLNIKVNFYLPEQADMNDYNSFGFFSGINLKNAPTTGWFQFMVFPLNNSPKYAVQIGFFPVSGSYRFFIRSKYNESWAGVSWKEFNVSFKE